MLDAGCWMQGPSTEPDGLITWLEMHPGPCIRVGGWKIRNSKSEFRNFDLGGRSGTLPLDLAGHRDKANGNDRTFINSIGGLRDDLQLLVEITDRNHHSRTYRKLLE